MMGGGRDVKLWFVGREKKKRGGGERGAQPKGTYTNVALSRILKGRYILLKKFPCYNDCLC